jgi:hypothetical protein
VKVPVGVASAAGEGAGDCAAEAMGSARSVSVGGFIGLAFG